MDGVGAVTLNGGAAREIHVVVDIEKLNARGLSIDQVREAIQKENVEIPGGSHRAGQLGSGPAHAGPHRGVGAVRQHHHRHAWTACPVRVADIGHTEDTVEKSATILRLNDGSTAVQLDIRRASGENTIQRHVGHQGAARTACAARCPRASP